ncbi:Uma2 family endonuclease [Microcoleus sp. PH2017_30_WIL_O_A]|uniref:Uma2 family endonuclease n=1 Tax=Microcoleus sp. PH2017_30_WIL_O_A TaxID=2798840 RepID=UPI001D4C835D|nr:Uma2 family endonuclease [Microcoleus sp. PH2017_30_WIL_O_A]MCC3586106.1 Uma2 family endonuclease [Microcoleus sp. PH2017_30_WIL_O_A]
MVIAQTNPPNLASDATKTSFTPDEYRAMEETAEERHEYCNGEIIAMPGGSEVHSAIACNLLIYLGFLLRDTDFRLYNSDLRVWIPEYNCGTYTDLMVVNGEPEFHGSRTDEILNPLLIVEVLSPSTCEYLLVSQAEPYIEQYHNLDRPSGDRWQWQVYDRVEGAIVLHSLNIELPMAEIYRRISL